MKSLKEFIYHFKNNCDRFYNIIYNNIIRILNLSTDHYTDPVYMWVIQLTVLKEKKDITKYDVKGIKCYFVL